MSNTIFTVDIERDLNQIVNLIEEYVDKTYLLHLQNQINHYRKQCENSLCREAQLLRALIPFMPEQETILQKIVEFMIYNEILERGIDDFKQLNHMFRTEDLKKDPLKMFLYKTVFLRLILYIENKDHI